MYDDDPLVGCRGVMWALGWTLLLIALAWITISIAGG